MEWHSELPGASNPPKCPCIIAGHEHVYHCLLYLVYVYSYLPLIGIGEMETFDNGMVFSGIRTMVPGVPSNLIRALK